MKVLAIIPARGGSKGVPRKNIKMLGGKPLMAYTIDSALKSKLLHTVMVSTEDAEIAEIAAQCGLPVPFMRPAELAQDASPTLDVVLHVIHTYKKNNILFDAVMILEPTSPFRQSEEIDECIRIFTDRGSDSLITVNKVPEEFNPHVLFEVNGESMLKKSMDTNISLNNLPAAYARDGSVYITKIDVVLKKYTLYGNSIAYKLKTYPLQINIDNLQDWEEAEKRTEQYSLEKSIV